mmetsp:Transcript_28713/g.45645  ORF Transcript_28713/g.45645 Transcript_28713/m.45645 type:complete len:406 (-) Transcript_28713:399-1616(-)
MAWWGDNGPAWQADDSWSKGAGKGWDASAGGDNSWQPTDQAPSVVAPPSGMQPKGGFPDPPTGLQPPGGQSDWNASMEPPGLNGASDVAPPAQGSDWQAPAQGNDWQSSQSQNDWKPQDDPPAQPTQQPYVAAKPAGGMVDLYDLMSDNKAEDKPPVNAYKAKLDAEREMNKNMEELSNKHGLDQRAQSRIRAVFDKIEDKKDKFDLFSKHLAGAWDPSRDWDSLIGKIENGEDLGEPPEPKSSGRDRGSDWGGDKWKSGDRRDSDRWGGKDRDYRDRRDDRGRDWDRGRDRRDRRDRSRSRRRSRSRDRRSRSRDRKRRSRSRSRSRSKSRSAKKPRARPNWDDPKDHPAATDSSQAQAASQAATNAPDQSGDASWSNQQSTQSTGQWTGDQQQPQQQQQQQSH